MEEQLVSYETALKAKEKGFDILIKPVYAFDNWDYNEWRCFKEPLEAYNNSDKTEYGNISAPTQSLLQKWLRDIHNIDVIVKPFIKVVVKVGYHYEINSKTDYGSNIAHTYEQALEIGLQEALNLIK